MSMPYPKSSIQALHRSSNLDPNGVFESPSPTFQPIFGGSVNLNDCVSANGAKFRCIASGLGSRTRTHEEGLCRKIRREASRTNERPICVKGHDKHFSGIIEIYREDNRLSFVGCSGVLYLPCGRGLSDVRVVPPSDICDLLKTSEGP